MNAKTIFGIHAATKGLMFPLIAKVELTVRKRI